MGLIPSVEVTINGQSSSPEFSRRLNSIAVTDESGLIADRLEMIFSDQDASLKVPPRGAKFKVSLGYGNEIYQIGTFYVDDVTVSGTGLMHVYAKGFDTFKDMKTICSRNYNSRNLKELIEKVGSVYDLKVKASDDLKKVVFPEDKEINQHNESCIHFLTRLCQEFGATLKIQDDTILVVPTGLGKTVSGRMIPVISLKPGDLKDWQARFVTRPLYKSVEAEVFDLDNAESTKVVVGSGKPRFRFKEVFDNEDRARNACEAKFREALRDSADIQMELEGNPKILAETILKLEGFRAKIDGRWLVTSATHRVSPGTAYVMSIDAQRLDEE